MGAVAAFKTAVRNAVTRLGQSDEKNAVDVFVAGLNKMEGSDRFSSSFLRNLGADKDTGGSLEIFELMADGDRVCVMKPVFADTGASFSVVSIHLSDRYTPRMELFPADPPGADPRIIGPAVFSIYGFDDDEANRAREFIGREFGLYPKFGP